MPLDALTDGDEIAATFRRLAARLADGATATLTRPVGWQGGGHSYPVHWHADLGMWGLADDTEPDCLWLGFGDQDPTPEKAGLVPVFQIGLPRQGIDRKRAGVFAADDKGRIFVAHNGGFAGGRAGVSKSAFWEWYNSRPSQPVYGPDKGKDQYVLLGDIDDPDLLPKIAAFLHLAKEFKERAVAAAAAAKARAKAK